jgi:hypothetical protein
MEERTVFEELLAIRASEHHQLFVCDINNVVSLGQQWKFWVDQPPTIFKHASLSV